MLDDAMTALAVAGSTAVVQAAGTDAWAGVRRAVAHWFGRGDEGRERAELARLDRTEAHLVGSVGELGRRLRDVEGDCRRNRFEIALEDPDEGVRLELGAELESLVTELRELLARCAPPARQANAYGAGAAAVGKDAREYRDRFFVGGDAPSHRTIDRPFPANPAEG
ncbi:hypothetical protein AB0B50_42980 [Streptomyces sp. NPDC041068]|uniref:hypothetical protein n=1 Tax=Streptomyces sp. NPDC041068 TaxID=3155130 RepID=UPI0033F47D3A